MIWYIHFMVDTSLIRSGDVNVFIEDDVAELVHYREWSVDNASKPFNSNRMMRFKSEIIERLQIGINICLQ